METERNTHLPSSSRPMMTSSGRTGTGFGIGNSRGSRPTSNSNNHNYSDINNMSNGTENLPLENRGTRRSGVTGGAGEGGYGYEHIDILSTSRAGVGTGTGRAGGGAGAAVGGGYGHINTYDKKLRPTSSYGLDRMASASAPVPVPKPLTPTSASTSVAAARTNTSVVKSHARSTSTANSGAARLASGLPLFLPPPLPLPLRSMMMMTKDEPNERGVGLENYKLGESLGKGASAHVFKALNWATGETVAVKRIPLSDIGTPTELSEIMSEIDLLKNLNHENIVKYKGFLKSEEFLFIILEFCENGSLQTICKRYGKFPEDLVAMFMFQVLQGLIYLHSQGVIHRDIKGANILTNKDGKVKLADFGVATMMPGMTVDPTKFGTEQTPTTADESVVGSPYWMAPEIIEQKGASTASDIWSLGCVVIELLEGKPPYNALEPMQALFRIVQDDNPPIPEGASPIVQDFLYQCFQKDPNLRVTAKKLAKHPWMVAAQKQDEAARPPSASYPTESDPALGSSSTSVNQLPPQGTPRNTGLLPKRGRVTVRPRTNSAQGLAPKKPESERRPLTTVYAQAVQRVQEWNEALKAAPTLKTIRRVHHLNERKPVDRVEESSSGESLAAHLRIAQARPRPSLAELRAETSQDSNWDNDFVEGLDLGKRLDHGKKKGNEDHDNTKTLMPTRSPLESPSGLAKERLSNREDEEDWSDFGPIDIDVLQKKLKSFKLKTPSVAGRIYHPDDISRTLTIGSNSGSENSVRLPKKRLRISPQPAIPKPITHLSKYAEGEEDDFADLNIKKPLGRPELLQLNSRHSDRSWRDNDEGEEDDDPFEELDDAFNIEDITTNLERDKLAKLCSQITESIEELQPKAREEVLMDTIDALLSNLTNVPELVDHFVVSHGPMAVVEVLEARRGRQVNLNLLRIINLVVAADTTYLESFCLVGGIPTIMLFTSTEHPLETRLEASTFVESLTGTESTLQMFISCRGLQTLVQLLDEDYRCNRGLVLSALTGITSVFSLQSATTKNDFCRMFVREGIAGAMSTALETILQDNVELDDSVQGGEDASKKITSLVLLFCQTVQSDARIREALGTRHFVTRLLDVGEGVNSGLLVSLLKALKHLSNAPTLRDVLYNSNAIRFLVNCLDSHSRGATPANDICSHVLQTLYNLCQLSRPRQDEAARAGLLPVLKRLIEANSQLKEFALPLVCEMINAGKEARRQLWRIDGLRMYLNLLEDPYWRISSLEAIVTWLQDETAKVEDVLLERSSLALIMLIFTKASGVSFEGILEPTSKILRTSRPLCLALAQPPFFKRIAETLSRKSKPTTRLTLLRMLKTIGENHPDRASLVERFGLTEIVDRLASQDEAVLVRELAKEVSTTLLAPHPSLTPSSGRRAVSDEHDIVPNLRHSMISDLSSRGPRSASEYSSGRPSSIIAQDFRDQIGPSRHQSRRY